MREPVVGEHAIAPDSRLELFFAIALAVGSIAWAGYQFARFWQGTLPPEAVERRLQAYQPENGGWVGEPLQVESGQPVRLVVDGMEGVHAFAIAHTGLRSPLIRAGLQETIAFTAPEPGRYVLYCTVWCGPDHWRMRTVLEVIDPQAPGAPLRYVQDPQRYTLPLDTLRLDEPHPASTWPVERPRAEAGAVFWGALAPQTRPGALLEAWDWPLATPAQVFEKLSAGEPPLASAGAELSATERWALVAFLWRQKTTTAALRRGAELYSQNCVACHGVDGAGHGFAAGFSPGEEPNFQDPVSTSGASPALYYAKIARGGMGTGMPNWGTILTEAELWAVTDYLMTFLFDYEQQFPTEQ